MKRPLFCVALAYALGEVVCLYTKSVVERSVVFAMLLCCGIYYGKRMQRWKSAFILLAGMLLGVWRAFFCIPEDIRLAEMQGREQLLASEDRYSVYVIEGQRSEEETVTLVGIISGKTGDSYVLRVCGSTNPEENDGAYILLRGVSQEYSFSSVVLVTGKLQSFAYGTNPGEFASCVYYQARNISSYMFEPIIKDGTMYVKNSPAICAMRMYYRFKQSLYDVREQLKCRFSRLLPEDTAALYSGILLGDKSEITPETKKLYQVGGVAHILAISGLHISLLGSFLFKLLRRLHLPFVVSGGCAIVFVILYGIMTGFSLATLRAIWMLIICMVAEMFGKSYDMQTSMGIALFFMLLEQPTRILDSGVQLSYMAIAGVVVGRRILRQLHKNARFRRWEKRKRILYRILKSVIMAFCLQVLMLPVLASAYYEVSIYAGLLNLLVVPIMPVVVVCGWLGVLGSFLNLSFGSCLLFPGKLVLRGYEVLCRLTVSLPGSTWNTGSISRLQMLVYYAGIAAMFILLHPKIRNRIRDWVYKYTGYFWQRRGIRMYGIFCVSLTLLVEILSQAILVHNMAKETICFLDVGQGDGILIRTADDTHIVIDGGSTNRNKLGEYVIIPALKSMRMAEVDYWFVTHTDEDHINGLIEILEMGDLSRIRIHTIVVSKYIVQDDAWESLQALAAKKGVQICRMGVGDHITDGSFALTCMHPDGDYVPVDKNAASLALAYHSNTMSVLFTGDMDADGIQYMLEKEAANSGELRDYDCIKIPHHGSKYSYEEDLYSIGKYMVISCGKNNRYGHPHMEVVEGIQAAGGVVVRTDEWGAIVIR